MPGMDDDKVVQIVSGIKIDLSQPIMEFLKLQEASRLTTQQVKANLKSIDEVSLANLSAQVANLQARIKLENISSNELREQVAQHAAAVKELREKVALEGALTQQHKEQVLQLQKQQKLLSAQVSEAAAQQRATITGQLTSMAWRRISWFATGAAMFGLSTGLRQVIDDVADVEMRMISLARVMEDPLFTIDKMRTALYNLAQEFGFTFQEVQEIALRWAQAGYDMAETIQLTRASLLALNTAELDAEQATQSLIGIMAQWGFQADQLTSVVDKLNIVADEYAVTSQDLVDGLLRASGAARAAGMTFEQTVALLTTMREASGRTGKEVGNALNSIIAYLQRAKSLQVLTQAGIPVYANPEGTQLRSIFDILSDISEKWAEMEQRGLTQQLMEEAEAAGLLTEQMAEAAGALEEWTDLQKRDILAAGAGVYRRNYLLALLNNFSQVYDVLLTQERAMGYSQRENERTMQAYQKQVAALKAEFQELAYALAAEGGPLDMLKAIVGHVREAVNAFNQLPSSVKSTINMLAVIAMSLTALNAATRLFAGKSLVEVIKQLANLRQVLAAAKTGVVAATGSLAQAAAVILPLAAAVAGLVYYYAKCNQEALKLQDTFKQLKEAADEEIRSLEAQVKVHAEAAKTVLQLTDQYRALEIQRQEAIEKGDESAADLAAKQQEIAQRIEEAVGRETAARLKAANYSKEAAQAVADAEEEKAHALTEAVNKRIGEYKRDIEAQMQATLDSINMIEAQMEGWDRYLTMTERVKLWIMELATAIKQGNQNILASWHNFLYELESSVASVANRLYQLTGWNWLKSLSESAQQSANENLAKSWDYRSNWILLERQLEEWERQLAEGPLKRQREHLADLREELASLMGDLSGLGSEAGEGAGYRGEDQEAFADRIRSVVDAIVAETEALGALNEAQERQRRILEERIAYYSREGASLEELQRADRDRAELIDLLTRKQEALHWQAESARKTYAQLEQQLVTTFGKVYDLTNAADRAAYFALSDEQREAYDAIADAMERMLNIAAENGAEWWRLQSQIVELQQQNNAISVTTLQILERAQKAYEEGTLSLQSYALALQVLRNQTGLSSEALKALAEAERQVKQEQFDAALDDLKDKFETGYISLEQYIEGLRQLKEQAAFSKDALEELNEEQRKAVEELLRGRLEEAFTQRFEEIESEIKAINDELKKTVDNLDAIFDGFDRVTRQMDRAATRTNLLTAYNAFMGESTQYGKPDRRGIEALARQALSGFGLFDVSALGALSPDDFARVMREDLDSLRRFSVTAKDYLAQVGGYASQRLTEIEDEMRRIDEWYERRIAELQAQLDALDREEREDERAKAEEEYNKRIQALEEERAWVLLQNEEDAAFKIAAIDAQLAQERAKWSEQLTQWQREDQRERIRNEMDEVRQRADAMRRGLEEQRRAVQEQQQLMTDLLNAILEAIDAEIEARREATEDYKSQLQQQAEARTQDLEDTKTWLEEKRKAIDENWASILADMAARDPQFYARGQSLVDKIIEGIKSRKEDLQRAVDELNGIIAGVRSRVSIAIPSLNATASGTVHGMAEGAYVRGGKGGVLALIGEKAHDEIVFPVPKITPIMADAMRQVMATSSGLLGDLPRAIASAVQKALANTSFYGAFDITLPDGTVERQVIRVFSGLTPHVRTS